jgi:predicted methyltransferase
MRMTIAAVLVATLTVSGSAQEFMADAGAPAVVFPNPDRPVANIVSPIWHDERERDAAGEPRQLVRLLGIKSGMTVADIGAGSGYYVVRLSPIVGPRGRIIAEDVVPEYLRELSRRVRALGLRNVAISPGEPHDPRLPPDSLDIAILVHMYHITRSHSPTHCSIILSPRSSLARASALSTPSNRSPSMERHQVSCAVSLQP